MKIIDLLNKIANGEKVPKTILFWDKEYKLDDEYKCYMHKISEDIFDDLMNNNNDELDEFLNDTVEIIEDNDWEELKKYIENFPGIFYVSSEKVDGERLSGKLIPTTKVLNKMKELEEDK